MKSTPFVSIIIPTFNRGRYLAATLDSFIGQSYPKERYEIIIANNNSTDNTEDIIKEYCVRFGCVKTIFESRQGVHYARNSAAKRARGDILYYTDDDMIADPCLLRAIVKVFDLEPGIGTVTGKIVGRFDREPPEWVNRYLINSYLSLTAKDRQEELIISPNDIGVYSCHQAIRRDLFFATGGFNPENTAGVWIGDGETGLNMKIKRLGYKFAYTSDAIICHIIPRNRTTLRYLMSRMGNQGFSDSYTEYRKYREKSGIIPAMLKRNTIGLARMLGSVCARIATRRLSWHFLPASLTYFHKRNLYDLRLYRSERFRAIAEIDDWLDDEQSMAL